MHHHVGCHHPRLALRTIYFIAGGVQVREEALKVFGGGDEFVSRLAVEDMEYSLSSLKVGPLAPLTTPHTLLIALLNTTLSGHAC